MLTQSAPVICGLPRGRSAAVTVFLVALGFSSMLYSSHSLAHEGCLSECTDCNRFTSTTPPDSGASHGIHFCQGDGMPENHYAADEPARKQQGLTKAQRAALLKLFAAIARHQ